jgi:hypothetical protein
MRAYLFLAFAFIMTFVLSQSATAYILKGVIVDEANRPVEGIKVTLLTSKHGVAKEIGWSVASRDGKFVISYNEPSISVIPSMEYLVASSDSLLGIEVVRNKKATQRVVCCRRGSVSGIAKDSSGKPVSGVVVRPDSLVRYAFLGEQCVSFELIKSVCNLHTTVTNAEGQFTLDGLPMGWWVKLRAVSHDVDTSYPKLGGHTTLVSVGASNVDLLLNSEAEPVRYGRIRGQVVRLDTGQPIPEVLVFLSSTEKSPMIQRTSLSQSNGEFFFDELPVGTYVLGALESPLPVATLSDVKVVENETTTVTLYTVRSVTVEGKVVAADTGKGLSGVMVFPLGGKPVVTSSGQDAGRFTVEMLPGMGVLSAVGWDQGYGQVNQEVEVSTTGAVVEMKLPRATVIQGQVTTSDGKPVDGALLRIVGDEGSLDLKQADSNGIFKFVFDQLSGKLYYLIAYDYAGSLGAVVPICPKQCELNQVDVRVHPTASFEGILKNEDGSPIEGAVVTPLIELGGCRLYSLEHQTRSDKFGRFSFKGLIAETRYVIKVSADGYGPIDIGRDVLPMLKAGQTASTQFTLKRVSNSTLK